MSMVRRRSGFTLAELLIVIAIVGILGAMSAGAFMQYLSVQRIKNVELLVSKIDKLLESQYKTVHYQAQSSSIPSWAMELSKDASGNPNSIRARVIYRKMLFKQAFPQSFAEILSPPPIATPTANYPPLPGLPTYVNQLLAATNSSSLSPEEQTSTCLYMILGRAISGAKSELDSTMSSVEAVDPHGIGIKHFRDAWDNPIVFRRCPNDLVAINSTNSPNAGSGNDYDDPEGTLCSPTWGGTQNAQCFLNMLNNPGAANIQPLYPSPLQPFQPSLGSYNIFPVIGSMGPDRQISTGDDIYVKAVHWSGTYAP